ncbi:MAG: methyltransferase domain-containing protein [Cyanobacteriota bacterium]|nr:methyltransferase domain-containing protein [Cyanobacteriota bacterium]
MTVTPFSERVAHAFRRRVAAYEPQARLQRSVAWRLAGLAHHRGWPHRGWTNAPALAPPAGPCADLGAGTGLLGRALTAWGVPLPGPLLQLDLCGEALARNGAGPTLPWDLNDGLPPQLEGASLLTSSFALQWLDAPTEALAHWGQSLAPGGWLLLALPTAGSFPEWHQAARQAQVPCSALELPEASALLQASARSGLAPIHAQTLTFSQQRPPGAPAGPLPALRAIAAIGADASQCPPLSPGAWRRLLAAWPAGGQLSWEVLLLLARKPHSHAPQGDTPCSW